MSGFHKRQLHNLLCDWQLYKKSFSTFFGNNLDYGVDERFPKRRSGLEKIVHAFVRDLNRIGRWGDDVTAVVQIGGSLSPAEDGCAAEIAYGAAADGWFVYSISTTNMEEIE